MALAIVFDSGDSNAFPCTPAGGSLDCAICDGKPPYTVTTTKGTIQMLTATNFRIIAPENTGSGVVGSAYEQRIVGNEWNGIDCSDIIFVKTSGCAMQTLTACAAGSILSPCPSSPTDPCGHVICTGSSNPYKQSSHCTLPQPSCATVTPTFTAGLVCDIRTTDMIDNDCAPCIIVMDGAVVTVTDADGVSVSRTLAGNG